MFLLFFNVTAVTVEAFLVVTASPDVLVVTASPDVLVVSVLVDTAVLVVTALPVVYDVTVGFCCHCFSCCS